MATKQRRARFASHLRAVWLGLLAAVAAAAAVGGEIRLAQRPPDPYGCPRPGPGAVHVPLRTSFCFAVELADLKGGDSILGESLTLGLQAADGPPTPLLSAGRRFVPGARGWLRPRPAPAGGWTVYLDPGLVLQPATVYTLRATARSRDGAELPAKTGTWSFTTETGDQQHKIAFALDLDQRPAQWQGGFFTGICNVVFCTRDENFGGLFALMRETQAQHPRAWRYRRDIWLTATDDRKPDWHLLMDPAAPNIVREKQTRRIKALRPQGEGTLLEVEDFFGCRQYGVTPGRRLSEDYQPGYEILVADGVSDARAKVVAVDDAASTVLVSRLPAPKTPWLLDYQAPLPEKENPDAPGLFAAGGAHLRRFDPPGTPVYYWGRLDKEYDLAVAAQGRIAVNFVEAPSDFSLTGRPYTRPKDYAVWHEIVRTIAGHLMDRYGAKSRDFAWTVFNEPDLIGDYWRFHWDEVQRFYDYTVDGVLRAFEDRGYDSRQAKVGGWELAAIFGPHLRLGAILGHCSPRATADGALPQNAAFADRRLDGKRSRRVEELCRPHNGKGSPCDFISIHSYNRAEMTATKLIRAKEMALATDADYYRGLWINCHESCPDWSPPPDDAVADSYLGNGYFPTWCLDVSHRLLQKAAADPRYGCGESVVTIWPPPAGLAGINTLARLLPTDDDGDGRSDRIVTVASPIFHALALLSDFGPDYWVLPSQVIGGHKVGGFASRNAQGVVRVAVFSHHSDDVQSRSERTFEVSLDLSHLGGKGPVRVTQHRFDRRHNSYYAEAVALRDGPAANAKEVEELVRVLEEGDVAALRSAFARIRKLDASSLAAIGPAFLQRVEKLTDANLRAEAQSLMQGLLAPSSAAPHGYPKEKVEAIRRLAELRATNVATVPRGADGRVCLTLPLAGNGANLIIIEKPDLPEGGR